MGDDSAVLNLHRLAIEAALSCRWQEALLINKQLIKLDPDNIDCLNRLAKAYLELGKYQQAKKICQEVLKLDAYNSIAQKNLQKATTIRKGNGLNFNGMTVDASLFLEEPGTTRCISLTKLAEPHKLLTLSCGLEVTLAVKNRGITIVCGNNQYLGALPDDVAFHLLRLLKGGNRYQAFVKSTKPNAVTILIREIFRAKKFRNQASFLDEAPTPAYSTNAQIEAEDLGNPLVAETEE